MVLSRASLAKRILPLNIPQCFSATLPDCVDVFATNSLEFLIVPADNMGINLIEPGKLLYYKPDIIRFTNPVSFSHVDEFLVKERCTNVQSTEEPLLTQISQYNFEIEPVLGKNGIKCHFIKLPQAPVVRMDIVKTWSSSIGLEEEEFLEGLNIVPGVKRYSIRSLLDKVDISKNLFFPLTCLGLNGKHYAEKTPKPQRTSLPDIGGNNRRHFQILRRHLENFPKPDIWDLLLPVLQPPLMFDFKESLIFVGSLTPYPYQLEGIKFLYERQSALLGDDMGTGKTVQSICAARLLFRKGKVQKMLVLVPLSVLTHWDKELERWAPELRVSIVRGDVRFREVCWQVPVHVYVTTYETFRQDAERVPELLGNTFDLVICDEAQRIKNPSSGISQAVRQLSPKYRWALTGTPIENNLEELAAIFKFVKPGLFKESPDSVSEARDLIKPYFLRRRRTEVLKDLPDKQEFTIWLSLGDKQQQTYNKLERERVIKLRNKEVITAHSILTLIQELKKICNRDPESGESVKLDWLKDNLPDIFESGDKVLVFTQYRQEQFGGSEWLAKELREFGALNYSDANSDTRRSQIIREFQNRSDRRIFIGHPKTAGVGLNELVVANYVVHFDHWWNPATTEQATARVYRPNQKKNVFVYHLWIQNTIEEMILNRLQQKKRIYDEVIDSLSTETPPDDVIYEIFDDLLSKHGFEPLKLSRSKKPLSLQTLTPLEFENVVAKLFERMGYNISKMPDSQDGGGHIIASKINGRYSEKLVILCKYQARPVDRSDFLKLLGVMASDSSFSKGILATNNEVTKAAMQMIRKNEYLGALCGREIKELIKRYSIFKEY